MISKNPSERKIGKKPISWWREKSRRLYFFCKVILSTMHSEKFQNMGILHLWLCYFLDDGLRKSRRKQVLIFRGSFKTTILLGYCLWKFCWAVQEGLSLSICYNTGTRENAEAFMDDFRDFLIDCKALRDIFPKLPATEDKYRRFTLKKVEFRNVRFHVASLETKQTGRHYNLILNDDLVDDKNYLTEETRKKVIEQWKFQKSILTRYLKTGEGIEIDCGTPYHSRDLVNYIRTKIKSYDVFAVPYALEDGRGKVDPFKENGILTFPELYTWADFRMKREEQGASMFANQYGLETLEETDVLCKPEWLRRWRSLPESYWRKMVIDPAGVREKGSSASGITICDVDPLGYVYVVFADRFWVTPGDLIKLMEKLKTLFKPDEIKIEKEKYSDTIADTLPHWAPKLQFSFVEHRGNSKNIRIMRMKQWFELGKILIGENMETLESMILSYQGEEEGVDLLDSLAYQIQDIMVPKAGRKRSEEGRDEDDFAADLEKIRAVVAPRREPHDSIF